MCHLRWLSNLCKHYDKPWNILETTHFNEQKFKILRFCRKSAKNIGDVHSKKSRKIHLWIAFNKRSPIPCTPLGFVPKFRVIKITNWYFVCPQLYIPGLIINLTVSIDGTENWWTLLVLCRYPIQESSNLSEPSRFLHHKPPISIISDPNTGLYHADFQLISVIHRLGPLTGQQGIWYEIVHRSRQIYQNCQTIFFVLETANINPNHCWNCL